jgi:hypothetical protein
MMNICKSITINIMGNAGCKTWMQQREKLPHHPGKFSRGYVMGSTRASVFRKRKYGMVQMPIFFIIFLGLGEKVGS